MEMKMTWLSLKSNPLWSFIKPSPVDLLTYHGELQQGTLWDTDAQGFKTPSNGRAITSEEESFLKQYNLQRQQLNEASRRAIVEVMKRVMPTSDGFFKELTDV